MQTVEEYHAQAVEQLTASYSGNDMRHRAQQIERAGVYAELAKTAEYAEAEPLGAVASVVAMRPKVEATLAHGVPDGWRWVTYEEAFNAFGVDRIDVDKAFERRGIQIMVKL